MVAPMAAGLEYAGLARGAAYGTAVALDGASWAPVAVAAYEHLPAGGSSSSSGLPMSGYIPSGTRKRHRQQNGGGYAKKKGAAPRKMILRKSVLFFLIHLIFSELKFLLYPIKNQCLWPRNWKQ